MSNTFRCELCNACFKRKENLISHSKRKRLCVEVKTNFKCNNCNKIYSSRSGYDYHKLKCKRVEEPKDDMIMMKKDDFDKMFDMMKIMTDKVDGINIEVKDLKKENIELKNEIKSRNTNVNNGNVNNTTNSNNVTKNKIVNNNNNNINIALTKQYITENFLDLPILLPMTNYDSIIGYRLSTKVLEHNVVKTEREKIQFIMDLISMHKKNKLVEYLGSYLILCYKKEPVSARAFWTIDNARLTFMIKTRQENVFWKNDKKGNIVIQNVIAPLLSYLFVMVDSHIKKLDPEENLNLCMYGNSLCMYLQNDKDLKTDILRFIAPIFTIDKDTKCDPITFKPQQITKVDKNTDQLQILN